MRKEIINQLQKAYVAIKMQKLIMRLELNQIYSLEIDLLLLKNW